jgi:hypothetical protein
VIIYLFIIIFFLDINIVTISKNSYFSLNYVWNNSILEVIAETYINAAKNSIIQTGFNLVYSLQNIKNVLCINKVKEINIYGIVIIIIIIIFNAHEITVVMLHFLLLTIYYILSSYKRIIVLLFLKLLQTMWFLTPRECVHLAKVLLL